MNIRLAVSEDLDEILYLFRSTIHHVNKLHYTEEQLKTWSSSADDKEQWLWKLETQYFILAEKDSGLAGFASITTDGYLDLLYVSKDFQRKGIAKQLLRELELFSVENGVKEITTESSITARPFFEKFGFETIDEQVVRLKEIEIINFKMKRSLNV